VRSAEPGADLIGHFQALARYNAQANHRLYAACALMDDTALRQQRNAFFGSILGTLNHLLVGDTIWLTRFEGNEAPSTGLDTILFERFNTLATARLAMDARIERFMAGLTEEFLAGSIRYVNNEGRVFDDPLSLLLPHFFNHQAHHRGQVHVLLTQSGLKVPPVLDLHRVLKPNP
jgi:uncharacterized damage-inducible protein DinB